MTGKCRDYVFSNYPKSLPKIFLIVLFYKIELLIICLLADDLFAQALQSLKALY